VNVGKKLLNRLEEIAHSLHFGAASGGWVLAVVELDALNSKNVGADTPHWFEW